MGSLLVYIGSMSATNNTKVYEIVTNNILDALDKGVAPWRIPWKKKAGGNLPRSMSTRKPYRGVNVLLLGLQSMAMGYQSSWWGTYKHISELGGQVRKDEHGTLIIFWTSVTKKDKLDKNGKPERFFMLRYYKVFNAEQADGLPEWFYAPQATDEVAIDPSEAQAAAEALVQTYLAANPSLTFTHDNPAKAYYNPLTDLVNVPSISEHYVADEYYSTTFHEFAHSTGHESRLARPNMGQPHVFGDEEYSKEELVAELAASFLQGTVGIESTVESSAAYLQHWAKVLRGDAKLIVQAAAQAQRAADYVQGISFAQDEPAEAAESASEPLAQAKAA
jgi:antirestriction protein ArdC